MGFDVQTRQKVVAELEWWENWGMWRAASEENMNICHHLSAGLLWWFLILAKGHAGPAAFRMLGPSNTLCFRVSVACPRHFLDGNVGCDSKGTSGTACLWNILFPKVARRVCSR